MERTKNTDVALIYELWENYAAEWSPGGDFERWMDMWADDGIQLPPDAPRNMGKGQIRAGNQPGYEGSEWKMKVYPDDVRCSATMLILTARMNSLSNPKVGERLPWVWENS